MRPETSGNRAWCKAWADALDGKAFAVGAVATRLHAWAHRRLGDTPGAGLGSRVGGGFHERERGFGFVSLI